MTVIDASALVEVLLGASPDFAEQLASEGDEFAAPELINLEVLSALRGQVSRGFLAPEDAAELVSRLRQLSLRRYPHHDLLGRVWELRSTMTSYDAVYVALAEQLGTHLVTRDVRLASANGPRCPVHVI